MWNAPRAWAVVAAAFGLTHGAPDRGAWNVNANLARLALAALLFGTAPFAAHGAAFDLSLVEGMKAAATPISEQDEVAIGRQQAGQLLGASPLTDDPALQDYVNKVGRWIASQSERPDLPWRFGVVET